MRLVTNVFPVCALCGLLTLAGCDRKTAPDSGKAIADGTKYPSQTEGAPAEKGSQVNLERAQSNSKPASDDTFENLERDYEEAVKKYRAELQAESEAKQKAALAELAAAEKALEDAKTDEEKQDSQKRLQLASQFPAMKMVSPSDGPGEAFSPRFLAFAVNNPGEPGALDALYLTLVTSGGPTGKAGTWSGAVNAIHKDHIESPKLKGAVRLFRMLSGGHDEEADKVLSEVIARNPDRRAQARACQALAQGRAAAAEKGERLKLDEGFRRNAEQYMGGKEGVEKLITGAAEAKEQADELTRTLREKYNDVCPDLSIGNPVPEVTSKTIDGKSVTLSSLKGRVVVLDIWATWCGPCVAMIPHEREMVERLKDKPFSLVSISADEEVETLTEFLEKTPMPWTHWWNGREGGIIEDWNVEAYPTIYVLDAQGVIRHKNLRGEKLEEAVNQLLSDMETN